MALEAPRLDDRSFNDLMAEAVQRIPLYCPEWTDHNLSDPGITLIELFAWMTDIVLYRLNRVPDKHYVKFLELVGMRLREAEPARVPITFWLSAPQPEDRVIEAGTPVATTRTESESAITFTTDNDAAILVPTLQFIMSSKTSMEQHRLFTDYNFKRLETGFETITLFESDPPTPDDALYLGFEQNLSYHVLGIEVEVAAAGSGFEPRNPPYIWEVLGPGTEQEWVITEVEYDGTHAFSESGVVRLHLPEMRRDDRNRHQAYWVRCRMMATEESNAPIYQVSPKVQYISASSWGITINASNVTLARNEILGRSDGSPGQRFYLEHTPVVPRLPGEHLEVRYDDGTKERWIEVSDFASSTPEDRHYTIDSMSGEVRLAPALPQMDGTIKHYGAIIPKNAMLVMRAYRFGGGRAGNVARGSLNVLKTALPYVDRVGNRQPSLGGLDGESLEDLKVRAPGHLRSLGRAVTAADYEYLTHEAAPNQVERVYCLQPPATMAGEVRLLVIPEVPYFQGYIAPESLRLSPEVREQIVGFLDERRLLSTRLDVSEPTYHWVQTEVRFRPAAKQIPDTVRQAVEARLYEYLNPVRGGDDGHGWTFGRSLFVSDLIALILSVPGVDFVRSVKLFPVSYDRGEYQRAGETDEVLVNADGVIASFEHQVIIE
jgi:predicted phage baseplate assembly protein